MSAESLYPSYAPVVFRRKRFSCRQYRNIWMRMTGMTAMMMFGCFLLFTGIVARRQCDNGDDESAISVAVVTAPSSTSTTTSTTTRSRRRKAVLMPSKVPLSRPSSPECITTSRSPTTYTTGLLPSLVSHFPSSLLVPSVRPSTEPSSSPIRHNTSEQLEKLSSDAPRTWTTEVSEVSTSSVVSSSSSSSSSRPLPPPANWQMLYHHYQLPISTPSFDYLDWQSCPDCYARAVQAFEEASKKSGGRVMAIATASVKSTVLTTVYY